MADDTESGCCLGCPVIGMFGGIFSVGGVIAFILSWKLFHAVIWALVAAFFSWAYVIYYLIYYWHGPT